HAQPAHASRSARIRHGAPHLIGERKIRVVHTGGRAENMKSPRASVHVEELVTAIARITLEFDLNKAVKVDRPEEPLGTRFNLRNISGLDIRGRSPESARMLAFASSRKDTVRLPVAEERAVGHLRV